MLEAKCLKKAVVPSTLIDYPSPGSIQCTRLALRVSEDGRSCVVYIASGPHIYKLHLHIALGESSVNEGKDSLLIPEHTEIIDSSLLNRCPHRSEIQSIALAEVENVDKLTYSALPHDNGIGEGSWSGLCFCPNQWSTTAVARSFCKTVDIYDQDMHIRTLRPLWYPTSLNFLQNVVKGDQSSTLAITEGSQLSIWDLRVKENGGCVHRVCGIPGDIFYAVSISSNGNVAVGGADRTVTIYDPRRWSALSRWVHCSKYEITGLAFSTIDPDCIYIQGVDYEVFCGRWRDTTKIFSFRGDSNWLGFSKCSGKDVLAGWCDSGSIFIADVASN
ncbi:uncharacterized protein LOC108343754 isoform X2 [Vigna angularis]|uniref:uncharacterized protein LOC108343754 isoform X2 n=1 Tax=Phaseolus angularis TaxID=3914 RepID=UPI000809C103|nr:uncharacterized protein LOC108343754 isoform X2 [Vigna angularis]